MSYNRPLPNPYDPYKNRPKKGRKHSQEFWIVLTAVGTLAGVLVAIVGIAVMVELANGPPDKSSTPNQPGSTSGIHPINPGPASPSPAQLGPAIRHKGSITVVGYGPMYDLDSTDPQWDPAQASDSKGDIGGYTQGNYVDLSFSSFIMYLQLAPTTPGTYATCRDSTGYQEGNADAISGGDLKKGQQLCITTDEGRYSLITIEKVLHTSLQFSATTWEKEG